MAEKRMFSKKITNSDIFIELPSSAQALYFHLNQEADDDGFNNQIQNAMFKAHATIDDLKILLCKNLLIRFENGVIVITHWRLHNTLRKDRYNPTDFQKELKTLHITNNIYSLNSLDCPTVAKRLPNGCQTVATDIDLDIDIEEKEIKEKEIDFCEFTFSEETKLAIKQWLEYKKQKRQEYKEIGWHSLLKKLFGWEQQFGKEYVINAIDNSIANNYDGIYADTKVDKKKKGQDYEQRQYTKEECNKMFDNLDEVEF